MWTCPKCGEKHDDQFKSCWKCAGTIQPKPSRPAEPDAIQCPRCHLALDFVGTKLLHEGTRWGILGDLGELFIKRESFDIFVCSRCGRVEFFVDGIGEELRPQRVTNSGRPLMDEAFKLYEEASKLEAKGELQEALNLYDLVRTRYPETEAALDAQRSVDGLRQKLNHP